MKAVYALVGMKHRGTAAAVAALRTGTDVVLRREPDNAYDRNAVQVWHGETHLGYVPRSQNAKLAARMDRARLTVVEGRLCTDGGRHPLIEVEE